MSCCHFPPFPPLSPEVLPQLSPSDIERSPPYNVKCLEIIYVFIWRYKNETELNLTVKNKTNSIRSPALDKFS